MTLKTLKDLEHYNFEGFKIKDGVAIDSRELRSEAIKWIKELSSLKYSISKIIKNTMEDKNVLLNTQNFEVLGAISFIKTFFNIKEEDLQ